MPKSVKKVKVGQEWHRMTVPTKFRIGTHKGGKSANLMSNEELEKVLADKNQAKHWNKAQAVLINRNRGTLKQMANNL